MSLEDICEELEEQFSDCTVMIGRENESEYIFMYYPLDDDSYPSNIIGTTVNGSTLEEVERLSDEGYVALQAD